MTFAKLDDNRRFPRIPYIASAVYKTGATLGVATVKNVGPGGMFLRTSQTFPEGEQINIELQFRHSRQKIHLKGEIVRRANDGLGIKLLW